MGGASLSTTVVVDGGWEDNSDSGTWMMSPEEGNWMVYGSESMMGTVIIFASEAG